MDIFRVKWLYKTYVADVPPYKGQVQFRKLKKSKILISIAMNLILKSHIYLINNYNNL